MSFKVELTPSDNQTVTTTDKLKFTTTVTDNNGTVTYKWYMDDTEIENATESSYILNAVNWTIGEHTLKVKATDETPEEVTDEVTITIKSQVELFDEVKTKLDSIKSVLDELNQVM
jgi:hypothetical protein